MVQLPDYTVVEKVHEGPMSTVYRGFRDSDGLPVVFKLPRALPLDPTEVQRLRHEASVLAQLKDVAGVAHSLGMQTTADGHPVLIIEAVPGRQLFELISRAGTEELGEVKGLSVAEVLQVGIALTEILAAVHARFIVHKDIKPHNIMLESVDAWSGAKLRLIDFGISALLRQEVPDVLDPEATQEGTPDYLPPEQTGRISRVIDYRSDYYALGATLYHLLTGQVLFPNEGPLQVLVAHIGRRPVPPIDCRPAGGRQQAVPLMVSNLIMKLLAKAAEDRYQSAKGLLTDLRHCLEEYLERGEIAPFALGKSDRAQMLRPPQRLYGRERESQVLWTAWDHVQKGGVELVLITGPGGVGKSALVQELLWELPAVGGRFAASKFDQLGANAPYEGIRRVLASLVQQTLAMPFRPLRELKRQLTKVLGTAGRVLTEIAPELELLIGVQPEVPALDGPQAHNRLSLLLCEFLRVMTAAEHPLVLFFDDLQWADVASLRTLQQVLGDPQGRHLLVVAAYRDAEILPGHALPGVIEQLKRSGCVLETLPLGPLSAEDSYSLVAETLSAPPEEIAPLAALAHRKTGGNPFFLGQFLRSAYERGLLHFAPDLDRWHYQLEAIAEQVASDNVLDFLVERLRDLPPETQRALALAAVIGFEFDHPLLSSLLDQSLSHTSAALRFALIDEIIFPIKRGYRLLGTAEVVSEPESATEDNSDTVDMPSLEVSYRFQHDRIQQAAYSLTDVAYRADIHLRVGRRLHKLLGDDAGDAVFDVVRHLNLGAARITDPAERLTLVALNQSAAHKAKAKTAYAMAAQLLASGLSLLDEAQRSSDKGLWFNLLLEQADCLQRSGQYEKAEGLLLQLDVLATTPLLQGRISTVRIELLQAMGQFPRSVAAGLLALSSLGTVLPDSDSELERALQLELEAITAQLAVRPLSELANLPELVEPVRLVELDLLIRLDTPTFAVNRTLSALITAKQVSLSLRHGNARGSVVGYMALAMLLSRMRGQYSEALRLGELALLINTRYHCLDFEARLRYLFGSFLPFVRPLREAIIEQQRAFEVGSAFGDMQAYFASLFLIFFRLLHGDPVDRVREDSERVLTLIARTNNNLAITLSRVGYQTAKCLAGLTHGPTSLSDEKFDEDSELSAERLKALPSGRLWYYLVKLLLLLLFSEGEPRSGGLPAPGEASGDEHAGLWALAEHALESAPAAAGLYIVAEFSFLYCLAGLQRAAVVAAEPRQAILARLIPHRDKISGWAQSCPANFACKRELLAAEWARVEGDKLAAMAAYDRAIDLAAQSGFPLYSALAAELAVRLHLAGAGPRALRRNRVAQTYLREAIAGYTQWHAGRKVEQLRSTYPHLTEVLLDLTPPPPVAPTEVDRLATVPIAGLRFDVPAVMKMIQAIGSQIEQSDVISQFLGLVISHMGAESASLLLLHGEELQLCGRAFSNQEGVQLAPKLPPVAEQEVPLSVVEYVARTDEALVLADASRDTRFAADRHIKAVRPKSLAALPLSYRGQRLGVLYMENNAISDAFSAVHIELALLLCAQAAIALEHMRVCERLEATGELQQRTILAQKDAYAALQKAHEQLEYQRTAELQLVSRQLQEQQAQRAQLERKHAALKEQLALMQRTLDGSTKL
jgi:predicted ATPase/GAF domain-containing protein